MKNVNQEEWVRLLEKDKDAIIIDARTEKEWRFGIQESSILMDVLQTADYRKKAEKLDKSKNYYVYCRSGKRSVLACMILEEVGIENTYNLLGGMMEWKGKVVVNP